MVWAPHRNAFQQRATLVDARQAVAQRGIHVKVRIDKRRAYQQALGIDGVLRRGAQAGSHFGDAAVLYGNRHAAAAVGQSRVGDEKVEHRKGLVAGRLGCGWSQIHRQPVAIFNIAPGAGSICARGLLGAENTVTRVAQAGHDVAVAVELAVDGGGVNGDIGVRGLQRGHAFGAGQQADELDGLGV